MYLSILEKPAQLSILPITSSHSFAWAFAVAVLRLRGVINELLGAKLLAILDLLTSEVDLVEIVPETIDGIIFFHQLLEYASI
ncbi:MAG: hypothetical protein HGB15_01915 [Chlorobaculum sp.]|nr:hypothetical protein [Chlorobaculum sp.]